MNNPVQPIQVNQSEILRSKHRHFEIINSFVCEPICVEKCCYSPTSELIRQHLTRFRVKRSLHRYLVRVPLDSQEYG
jgi:hypothetical protein